MLPGHMWRYAMTISVVMSVYNRREYFEACLRAISYQTQQPDEVIIADDATDKYSVADVARGIFPDAQILRLEPPKYYRWSKCLNAAMAISTGDIICITDADVIMQPEYLEFIHQFHERYSDIVVFPRVINLTTTSWTAGALDRISTLDNIIPAYICTGNMSFRRKWLYRTEGLNNTYDGHADGDVEFSAICCTVGLRLVLTDIIAYHIPHYEPRDKRRTGRRVDRTLRKAIERYELEEKSQPFDSGGKCLQNPFY